MTNITYISGNSDKGTYALTLLTGALNPNAYILVKRFGEADTSYNRVNFDNKKGMLLSERICTVEEKKECQKRLETFKTEAVVKTLENGNHKYYPHGVMQMEYKIESDSGKRAATGKLVPGFYIEAEGYDPKTQKAEYYSAYYWDNDSSYHKREASPHEIINFKAAMGDENMTSHLIREAKE